VSASVVCPHCAAPIDDPWEYDGNEDGSAIDIECPHCDKPCVLSCSVSVERSIEAGTLADRRARLVASIAALRKELGIEQEPTR